MPEIALNPPPFNPCTGAALLRPSRMRLEITSIRTGCGRDARAPRRRCLRARCPRSQARSHAALPAGKMPTLPGVLPRGAACGQDARTPRRRCLRARCPRSQACSQATLPAGKMPTLPGVLPGDAACGQDARAPRRRCLRARCLHSQACSHAALPAGKIPTLPGVLPGGAARGRDARAPRTSVGLRLPDSVALFRRELLRRSAARARRCRRSACDARDSPHHQSQRRA